MLSVTITAFADNIKRNDFGFALSYKSNHGMLYFEK